jgi:hypothetical protein
MMTKYTINPEIQKKLEQAKQDLAKKGINFDGLGDEIEKEGHEGPYFGPRNDIESRKVINDIRESGKNDDE